MGRMVKCPQGSRLWLRIIKWDQYLTRPLRAQTHTHTHNLHRFFPYQFLSRLPSLSSQPFTRSRHILAFSGTVIFFYKMFIKSFPLQHCHLVFAAALHFPFPIFRVFLFGHSLHQLPISSVLFLLLDHLQLMLLTKHDWCGVHGEGKAFLLGLQKTPVNN